METPHKARQRSIHVVSLSQSFTSTKETDLPTLLSNLRRILLKKGEKNEDIDANTSQCIQSIQTKIQELDNLAQPMEIFDTLQATTKTYINDLLSITQAVNILSNYSFQQIFTTLMSTDEKLDFASIFEHDPSYARTVCFRSFDFLSSPVIKDFLNDKYPSELFLHEAYVLRVITHCITSTIEYIVFKKNQLQNQIPSIRLLLEFVDRNKQKLDQIDMSITISSILNLIWALADDTMLVPNMIEANCSDYMLQWIAMEDLTLDIQCTCMHILHNLARHEKGVNALNSANCINILKDFKKRVLDPNRTNQDGLYPELRLLYCMVVSLLTEPKENREDLDNLRKILDQLMQLAVDAGQAINNKCEGFHVSEPIVVLTKLCVHDEILKYVLNESNVKNMEAETKIEFFCRLLIKFRGALAADNDLDQLTLIALFNILWSISFHEEYADQLKASSKFLLTVKSIAIDDAATAVDQYVPNHMSSLPKAANGILWNLDEDNPAQTARATTLPKMDDAAASDKNVTNRIRVMISYAHADQEFCRQLVDAIQKDKRLEVWVDFAYCHTEDLWEEIGEAIEKAHVILLLMSKDYQDSKSCRQEVMYAKDSLKKRFIPLYVKKDFVATGWLGVRIVGPQYIRFGKRPFEDTVQELLKLVYEDKAHDESSQIQETKPRPVPEVKPVENTTKPTENKPPQSTENSSTKPTENNPAKPAENNLMKPNENIHPESNAKPPKKPVEQWTTKDIAQWYAAHQIHQELVDIYDFKHGMDILLYGQCLRPDWQIEYNDVKQRYQQKYNAQLYRDHFVRFVGAVHRLQPSPPKSRSCVIS